MEEDNPDKFEQFWHKVKDYWMSCVYRQNSWYVFFRANLIFGFEIV